MRILYDGWIYGMQRTGGVNRYFAELISRLPPDIKPVIYGHRPSAPHIPRNRRLSCFPRLPLQAITSPIVSLWAGQCDVLHPTYYNFTPPLDRSSARTPVVLTVHDFVMVRYAHLYERSGKAIAAQDAAIRRADYLICVSQATRNDLLERYPECEGRSKVIYLGASVASEVPPCSDAGRSHVLVVGARTFYKNFELTLEAASHWRRRGLDVNLKVAGPPPTPEEQAMIQKLGLSHHVEFIVFPDDTVLDQLYRQALLLLYLSKYEGFGLPPLEAMARACPVVSLRTSSLPEVVGDGGMMIEPEAAAPDAIADAVEQIANDSHLRSRLCESAVIQAAKFRWEKTAQETAEVYNAVGR